MRRTTIVGVGLAGIGGLVLALVLVTRDGDDASASDPPAITPAPASSMTAPPPVASAPRTGATAPSMDPAGGDPTVEDVLRARADSSAEAFAMLLTALESEDAVVVAEATNAFVGRGDLSVLPSLIELDVIDRPWAAPSVIDAMGRLGAQADPEQRGEVVERLLALMREEKQRGAQESQGNLLQIYEALGQTGDPRAIAPLEGELVDATVPTAPKVVIVQALVALRATGSRALLERVAAELARTTAVGFEAELQRDLLTVIREALVQLS